MIMDTGLQPGSILKLFFNMKRELLEFFSTTVKQKTAPKDILSFILGSSECSIP